MSEEVERVIKVSRMRRALAAAFPSPEVLKLVRTQAALSQTEVASAIGVSRQAVSRYEAGNLAPSPETTERYLELLDGLADNADA